MPARVRPPVGRPWTPERVRERIRTGLLIRRLMDHINGGVELTATQVDSIKTLLRKTLPDLSAVEYHGTLDLRSAEELSDAELATIALGGGTKAPAAPRGEEDVPEVH